MSVMTLAVMVWAIWSPTATAMALEPSWARVIVSTSPTTAVTRAISAFVLSGMAPAGQIVTSYGVVANRSPSPVATVRDVPLSAGEGATATVE